MALPIDLDRVKHLGFYVVPSFFSKGVSVLLLPVYVAHLSLTQFGQLDLLVTILTLAQQGLHLGWSRAFLRFHHAEGVNPADVVLSLLAIRVVTLLPVFALVVSGEVRAGAAWLTADPGLADAMLYLALLLALRELILFFDLHFRVQGRAFAFAATNMSYAVLQFVAVYWMLAVRDAGVVGVLSGQVAASAVLLLALVAVSAGWLRELFAAGRVRGDLARRLLRFGLPLAPVAVLAWVMSTSDRYMLRWLLAGTGVSLEWVGLHAFAVKVASLVTMLLNGLGAFFLPWAFRIHDEPTAPERLAYGLRMYCAALLAVSLALWLVLPEVVGRFFIAYGPSVAVTFLLIAGILSYRVALDFSIGIDVEERTEVRMLAILLATGVNVGANFVLIPRLQIVGAGLASVMAGVTYAIWVMPRSQRRLRVPYAWSDWTFLVAWTAGAAGVLALAPAWRWLYAAVGAAALVFLVRRAGGAADRPVAGR